VQQAVQLYTAQLLVLRCAAAAGQIHMQRGRATTRLGGGSTAPGGTACMLCDVPEP
jgi:hypothetical protein